ncbi:hypothetical protein CYMTET_30550, partial [Cymbomonas tetramitiformis]
MPGPLTPRMMPGPVTPRMIPGPVTPRMMPGPLTPRMMPGPLTPRMMPGPLTPRMMPGPLTPICTVTRVFDRAHMAILQSCFALQWSPYTNIEGGQFNVEAQKRAVWSPVLHVDNAGTLWLFYAESSSCKIAGTPSTWSPGGDILAVSLSSDQMSKGFSPSDPPQWSQPRIVYATSEGDSIPK